MKQIMAEQSSKFYQGVPTFEFNPHPDPYENSFFPYSPLDLLEKDLLTKFKGKSCKMIDVYFEHNLGTPYLRSNYKQALLNLEEKGKIKVNPSKANRRRYKGKITMSDTVIISFPE